MNTADRPNSVEPRIIVRAGNQEWIVGQIQDEVDIRPVEMKATEKIVTLSALEDARKAAERIVRSRRDVSDEFVHTILRDRSRKNKNQLPIRVQQFLMQIGAFAVRIAARMTRHSTFSDSFKSGMIFGLALGCMSLLLFHQVVSPEHSDNGLRETIGAPTSGVLTRSVSVPGVHLFGLSLGTYANSRDALKTAKIYNAKGTPCVVVHLGKYVLLNQIADQSRDLNRIIKDLKKKKVEATILPIDVSAQKYPVLPSTSNEDSTRTSKWLASETSALVTMTAWAADGGRQVDAMYAFQNANILYPSDTVISATGLGVSLSELRKAVADGNAALSKGDKQGTLASAMRGYQILLDGQAINF